MNFLRLIFSVIYFSVIHTFRLLLSLPFHFWKYCVQWVGTHFGFGPHGLRKIISSNHYLGPDGRLLLAHNLLISLELSGLVQVSEFRDEFSAKCVLKRNSRTEKIELPELMEEIVIWCGYPFWREKKNFDIKNHIFDWTIDAFKYKNIEWLEKAILQEEFLRKDGSPWRIYLIHDNQQESTRLLFSFHHSLGDGVSMYGLLMRLTSNQNQDAGNATVTAKKKSLFSILRNFLPPRNPLLCSVPLIKNFSKCSLISPEFHLKPEEMTDKERMIVKSALIKKSTLTMIAKENKVPFTAVLLSAISGALRKYTLDNSCAVPDFILCPMPIPTHNQNKGLSNAVQNVDLTLPLGIEDLGQRLQKCGETLSAAHSSAFPLFVRLINFIQNAYPLTLKPGVGQLPPIILSSFPGPKVKVALVTSNNSYEVLDMDFAWNGCNYISVAITTLTYTDGIRIVLSVDPKAFKQSSSIMESIENEIITMHQICLEKISINEDIDVQINY